MIDQAASLMAMQSRLMSIAYRMLGSVVEAEDVVQDAYLKLQSTDGVRSPEGFLVRVTTRLCIDRLRSARRREKYIGPWVPEPIETLPQPDRPELSESLSLAFLLLLERLSPDERAAFLLRTVFDYDYAAIAAMLERNEASVRKLVSRARERLQLEQRRYHPSREEASELAERFLKACRSGDVGLIEQLLSDDAEVHSDGGGKVSAARVVVSGRHRAARFMAGVFKKRLRYCDFRRTLVNGQPGYEFVFEGDSLHVASVEGSDRIEKVLMVLNPEKLTRWTTCSVD
ncbi:RNA polymerase sigma factor SigJ [Rubinisphaera margarita]|uniref:RNA polymerase sigma factor SigJ n=1 Tax=Rubinisphaera margarita TaxID=2909586 RepID=UPI001EE87C19|nr:RNA polymerase sigma factor SigJ [Rubinisphaera margarita]MCG6154825.1 RNA polymerase sigma factor SigJ [Rubinisphaera margarita]